MQIEFVLVWSVSSQASLVFSPLAFLLFVLGLLKVTTSLFVFLSSVAAAEALIESERMRYRMILN
jgi:hypothetical protein